MLKLVTDIKAANILLVEDDDIDAEVLERLFKRNKMEQPLQRARNGVEALDILRAQKIKPENPIIILLDINMPLMNGIEFLQEIRADKNLKDIVVFMLTTSAREADIERAYALHAAGYFIKNNVTDLVGMLNTYCRINEFPQHRV